MEVHSPHGSLRARQTRAACRIMIGEHYFPPPLPFSFVPASHYTFLSRQAHDSRTPVNNIYIVTCVHTTFSVTVVEVRIDRKGTRGADPLETQLMMVEQRRWRKHKALNPVVIACFTPATSEGECYNTYASYIRLGHCIFLYFKSLPTLQVKSIQQQKLGIHIFSHRLSGASTLMQLAEKVSSKSWSLKRPSMRGFYQPFHTMVK
jgi:hypothetical protein